MRNIAVLMAFALSSWGLRAAPIPKKPATVPPKVDTQVKQLQGTWDWNPDFPQSDAEPRIDLLRVVIKDDVLTFHYAFRGERFSVATRFKLNLKAMPKEMDFTPTEGNVKGKTYLARYEMKDNQLKICYRGPGRSRPTDFDDKRERGHATVFIYLKSSMPKK
jgi:uncharacterized protein (TIGR03067 family)